MGTNVTLRYKKISGGRHSLYLDFYPPISDPQTGKATRREFLGKFIYDNPVTAEEKRYNKESLRYSEAVRNNRDAHINANAALSEFERHQIDKYNAEKRIGEESFLEYFQRLGEKRDGVTRVGWETAYVHLKAFSGGELKFKQVTEKFCNDFRDYLVKMKDADSDEPALSPNSAYTYFCKFKAALRQAYKDRKFQFDININISPVEKVETWRAYLTLEEMNRLIKTPCNNPTLKRAAIFSALTGLRFSDISKLVWKEIEHVEGQGWCLLFTQKKTGNVESLPISDQAYSLLGTRGEPDEKVFKNLVYSVYANKSLFQWIGAAGITKNVTFHSFRHTFATLQLSAGTDIYTVSKMLGHRDIGVTQIYAHLLDDAKRKAADRIKLDI